MRVAVDHVMGQCASQCDRRRTLTPAPPANCGVDALMAWHGAACGVLVQGGGPGLGETVRLKAVDTLDETTAELTLHARMTRRGVPRQIGSCGGGETAAVSVEAGRMLVDRGVGLNKASGRLGMSCLLSKTVSRQRM